MTTRTLTLRGKVGLLLLFVVFFVAIPALYVLATGEPLQFQFERAYDLSGNPAN